MRILMINVTCGIGSTGRICTDLAQEFEQQGHMVKIAYGRSGYHELAQKYGVKIGNTFDVYLHGIYSRLFDAHGFASKTATKEFLKWAEEYDPDLLWLHNIHGYYINVEMLFAWIKKHPQMKVNWTLHDCWAFTGHCSYFTMAKCEKWKTHCEHCPQIQGYPASYLWDNSYRNFDKKRELFQGVKQMQMITPSRWLADLTRESFLKEYPVKVVYNKVNREVFKPTLGNFREKYHMEGKKILLGVASPWTKRKGLDDFLKLSTMLDDNYVILLVGLDKKQIAELPKKIIGLKRTDSPEEAATVYMAAAEAVKDGKNDNLGNTASGGATAKVIDANSVDAVKGAICEEEIHEYGGIVVKQGVKNIYKVITGKNFVDKSSHKSVSVHKIICFLRTNNPVELAELYTAADWFVNPTYEDNFPTVNLEAVACGTKVITYDTGGCAETLKKFD